MKDLKRGDSPPGEEVNVLDDSQVKSDIQVHVSQEIEVSGLL